MKENAFTSTFQEKAVYYPNLTLQLTETRFGSRKLLAPENPYEKPLKENLGKTLLKIDKLQVLTDLWGCNLAVSRGNIYALVSGDTDDDRYRKLLCSLYKTHLQFANYVDRIVVFGSQDTPLIVRFTSAVRRDVNLYAAEVDTVLRTYYGTKLLLDAGEYLYYAVDKNCDYSKLEGVVVI